MRELCEAANAKLNLTLDVLGKRGDGYHDLCMVMQSVTLADTVIIRESESPGLTLVSDLGFLPGADKNIAAIAARVFAAHTGVSLDGVQLQLIKRIPVCAGTAGGSSDGAAVLRGLNRWFGAGISRDELARWGEEVGSDVPYCVWGTTALAEGRGEVLTELAQLPHCCFVLCKPGFSVSTPELFRKIDDVRLRLHPDTAGMIAALESGNLREVGRRLYNVFEEALPTPRKAVIEEVKSTMLSEGALGACMSGTGAMTFGLFADVEAAQRCYTVLSRQYPETYLAESC